MSDTTVVPQGAAPSAAAPANEVQINQSPTSSPNPIGSQAPEKPTGDIKGSEHRPESRRESIQKAFERANNPPPKGERPKPAPKAAEAKPGHNNPPEETEKFDLKKRPSDQQSVPRGERGQFVARTGNGQQPSSAVNAGQPVQSTGQRLADNSPYRNAPPRMSEHARAHWATTPEPVRADIHRMNKEVSQAFQYYKQDYETMKTLRPFAKMAEQHGTSLDKALSNYVSMEHKLRADPVAGLDTIVHNLGLIDPETNQRITLRDVAYHVLSQSPEQLRTMQQGNAQQAAAHQIGALHQEVTGLKNTLQQMVYQQQHAHSRSQVDQFAVSHPRFDEISDLIEKEIKLGFDLESAYRRAELLRPATHAAQTRTTSAQTRPVDRSIHGNPDVAPSNGASRRPSRPSGSPREATLNAMRRMNGSP